MRKIVTLIGALLMSCSVIAQEHITQLRTIQKQYAPVDEQITALIAEGKLAAANKLMLEFVPEEKKTAYDYLFLGNKLFDLDVPLSYQLHEKAYRMNPDDQAIILEYAMQKHRNREYAEAEGLYVKYLDRNPRDFPKSALLAECQIYLNKYEEAVRSWKKAQVTAARANLGAVDMAIHAIHGDESPVKRRDTLINQVKAGKADVEDLLLLDADFDKDWWNSSVYVIALEKDSELALPLVTKEPERYRALKLYTDFRIKEAQAKAKTLVLSKDQKAALGEELRTALSAANIILGETPSLPRHTKLAQEVIAMMQRLNVYSRAEMTKFEQELWRRAKSDKGDLAALRMLGNMSVGTPAIKEVDIPGWEKYKAPRFLQSHLISLATEGKLDSENKWLQDGITLYPYSQTLQASRLALLQRENKPCFDALIAAIKAEFAELSAPIAVPGIRTARRLNALFGELENEFAQQNSMRNGI